MFYEPDFGMCSGRYAHFRSLSGRFDSERRDVVAHWVHSCAFACKRIVAGNAKHDLFQKELHFEHSNENRNTSLGHIAVAHTMGEHLVVHECMIVQDLRCLSIG